MHHQLSKASGQPPSLRDERVGRTKQVVHDVLSPLVPFSFVESERGNALGVVEALHADDLVLDQGAMPCFFLSSSREKGTILIPSKLSTRISAKIIIFFKRIALFKFSVFGPWPSVYRDTCIA